MRTETILNGVDAASRCNRFALMEWIETLDGRDIEAIQNAQDALKVAFLAYKIKHDETSIDVSEYYVDDMEIWEDKHYVQLAEKILDDQEYMWWTAADNSIYTVVEGMIQGINEEIEFNKKFSEIKQ